METWELAAREGIRDLVARYNANGDSGRFDPMLELFCEDAVLEVPERRLEGRAAIRAFFEAVARGEGARRRVRLMRHHVATHQIDLLGPDEARGRCYYQVLTEDGLDHWGRYVDEYRREAAGWRFRSRVVSVDGRAPGSFSAGAARAPQRAT